MAEGQQENQKNPSGLVGLLEKLARETAGYPDSPSDPMSVAEAIANKSELADDNTSRKLIASAIQLTSAFNFLEPILAGHGPEAFYAMFDAIESAAVISLLHRGSPGEKLREALRKKHYAHALSIVGSEARKEQADDDAVIIRELAKPYIDKLMTASSIENKIRPSLQMHFKPRKSPGRTKVMDAIRPLLSRDN